MRFEWHEAKAAENLRKHQISFDEAKTVFNDPLAVTTPDILHSVNEERYIDMGRSSQGRLLVVVYTERDSCIRIISCRQATKNEQRSYERPDF